MDKFKDTKNCLLCFSGGETSGYMLNWVLRNAKQEYNYEYVFFNTSNENEQTLIFAKRCQDEFGIPLRWLEAVPTWTILYRDKVVKTSDFEEFKKMWHEENKIVNGFHCIPKMFNSPTDVRIVDFDTAKRNGEVFEAVIQRYGIPNVRAKICTRELKDRVAKRFCKQIGWNTGSYVRAIGIRSDEIDRISKDWKKEKFWYPLISDIPMTKKKVNFWWKNQKFRLNLKGYQGNCEDCFEKNKNKLMTLAVEDVSAFDFTLRMEEKYEDYIPYQHRYNEKYLNQRKGKKMHFFRGNESAKEIIDRAKSTPFKKSNNDSDVYEFEGIDDTNMYNSCNDRCEPFSS